MSEKVIPSEEVQMSTTAAFVSPVLTTTQGIFRSIPAVPVPSKYINYISEDVWSILTATQTLTVRQHMKIVPKNCCTCPPCVKKENTYSVYAGADQDAEAEFLRIDEVSDDWNRCCCAPYHPVRLDVRKYIPLPGDGSSSDFSHIKQDLMQDFDTLRWQDKADRVKDMYKESPVVFSMLREDGQRCCFKCPCKCLNCFVCCSCCQDAITTYVGPLQDGDEVGRPFKSEDNESMKIASVVQPNFGGYCWPTLHLYDRDHKSEPYAKIRGPFFFGGMSEFCCDFNFKGSLWNSKASDADVAIITKKKPQGVSGALREAFTDSDVYQIKFTSDSITTEQKTNFLAAQLLMDYMMFEGNTDKCRQDPDGTIHIYCCYCMILGKLCPCEFTIPASDGGGEF